MYRTSEAHSYTESWLGATAGSTCPGPRKAAARTFAFCPVFTFETDERIWEEGN